MQFTKDEWMYLDHIQAGMLPLSRDASSEDLPRPLRSLMHRGLVELDELGWPHVTKEGRLAYEHTLQGH